MAVAAAEEAEAFIAVAAAPLRFAVRAAGARSEDRWAAGPLWARPEVRQYVDRWVAALLWVRPGVRQCGGRRAAAPR